MSQDEIFPIVDAEGRTIGRATRRECHSGSRLLHPVVHLHVVSLDGRLLLQRRSADKDIQPGRWDTSVGGHVDYGESVADALRREAAEELSLSAFEPRGLGAYVFESDRERELVNVFTTVINDCSGLRFQESEISEIRLFTPTEIEAMTGTGALTPNFEQEYRRIERELWRVDF